MLNVDNAIATLRAAGRWRKNGKLLSGECKSGLPRLCQPTDVVKVIRHPIV